MGLDSRWILCWAGGGQGIGEDGLDFHIPCQMDLKAFKGAPWQRRRD